MRSLSSSGLTALVLVVVIAFALTAVGLLTGTLINAEGINQQVGVITHRVSGIDHNLQAVRLAAGTDRLAGKIYAQAQPLSGQLGQVVHQTDRINLHAASILATAGSIDRNVSSVDTTVSRLHATVSRLHATVAQLHGTVGSIHARVGGIDTTVRALGGEVASIDGRVHSIRGHVGAVQASVAGIHDSFTGILGQARLIDASGNAPDGHGGVFGINFHAIGVILPVRPVVDDLGNVLQTVGPPGDLHGSPGDATLAGHALSIDCRVNADAKPYCPPR